MALKGQKAHSDRLKRLSGPEVVKMAGRVVFVGSDMIRTAAQHSITTGSGSFGRHRASAPGTAPHNDTGVLKNNIENEQTGPLEARVTSNAPYAKIHEFGGTIKHPGGTPYFMRNGLAVFVSNSGYGAFHTLPVTKPHDIDMPQRPYMRPARDKMAPEIRKLFAKELDKLVERSGR